MNIALMLLSENVVNALGWTLFHSLWQGALAALGFAIVLYFTRRTSARARYAMGFAVLALVLLASVMTFWNHFATNATASPASGASAAISAPTHANATPGQTTAAVPPHTRRIAAFFSVYFSRHLPLLVSLWLLGVLFLSLRFTGTMLYTQRLKYRQNRPLPSPWPERLQALAAKAGMRRPLQLLESLRLRTPVVIGHLKPVLLLPIGLVTNLSAVEVEALLAHELAHVVRNDYLVNVAQNLMEIIYFFHPGVRWISSCVRQEREHCCDDFAVELCGDARGYARALASLQVDGLRSLEPTLAATGRGHKVMRRIVRLLGRQSRPGVPVRSRLAHDFREGFMSALLLVLGLLGMLKLASVSGGAAPMAVTADPKPQPVIAAKTRTANRFTIVSFVLRNAGTVKLAGTVPAGRNGAASTWIVADGDGQVAWYMSLAGRAQAEGRISFSEELVLGTGAYTWYLPAGGSATAQRKDMGKNAAWTMLPLQTGRLTLNHEVEEARFREERDAKLKQEQALHLRTDADRAMYEAQQSKLQKEEKRLQLELQAMAEARIKEEERLLYETQRRAEELEKQAQMDRMQMKEQERLLRVQEEQLRQEEKRLKIEEANFKKFISMLAAAGLIDENDHYEVRLSATALVVNHQKQPPVIHEKIKNIYETLFNRKLDAKEPIQIVYNKE